MSNKVVFGLFHYSLHDLCFIRFEPRGEFHSSPFSIWSFEIPWLHKRCYLFLENCEYLICLKFRFGWSSKNIGLLNIALQPPFCIKTTAHFWLYRCQIWSTVRFSVSPAFSSQPLLFLPSHTLVVASCVKTTVPPIEKNRVGFASSELNIAGRK